MTGEELELGAEDRGILADALTCFTTPDYQAARALVALAGDAPERAGRRTAMDREFVVWVRGRARRAGAGALLGDPMSRRERVLEAATDQIVAAGDGELAMSAVSDGAGIPLRTLYRGAKVPELVAMCRRRAQTIWRARFEARVLQAAPSPQQRLFATVSEIAAWVGSERFRRDQALRATSLFAPESRGDDLREHLAEIDRFATRLAVEAGLRAPEEFGAFVATAVAGAAAWFDRREAASAAGLALVERFVTRARGR